MNATGGDRRPRGFCVIMAGGRGTRFWPLSRTARPKQLLPLAGDRSLLRETYERVAPLVGPENVLVITSGSLAPACRAELPELPEDRVVAEPVGRNTAPCAVLGAGIARRLVPGAPVALLPADHHIPDADLFQSQLADAFAHAAARGGVVTFGVPPSRPETGYGYLEVAESPADGNFLAGRAFVEKPDRARAEMYLRGGRHFWNSGIFVWNPDDFAAAVDHLVPSMVAELEPAVAAFGTPDFATALETSYRACPADSIDYAVMEKLPRFTVLIAGFSWSDVGSWDAWGELAPALGEGNRGRGDLLAVSARHNTVHVPGKLVALVGVDDLIVVDTDDALLVCDRRQAQRLRDVIAELEQRERDDLL
ncbi:MAG: sugar phosphate nucleotidyltransferase [Candidatus Krumholzibacteriia bacterium]